MKLKKFLTFLQKENNEFKTNLKRSKSENTLSNRNSYLNKKKYITLHLIDDIYIFNCISNQKLTIKSIKGDNYLNYKKLSVYNEISISHNDICFGNGTILISYE